VSCLAESSEATELRPFAALRVTALSVTVAAIFAGSSASAQQSRAARLTERAVQTRDIVYFLRQPETHAFDLYHDYTESREGTDKYLNVVRKGSRASNPSALILDTGQKLAAETLRGEEITRAGLDIKGAPAAAIVMLDFIISLILNSITLRLV